MFQILGRYATSRAHHSLFARGKYDNTDTLGNEPIIDFSGGKFRSKLCLSCLLFSLCKYLIRFFCLENVVLKNVLLTDANTQYLTYIYDDAFWSVFIKSSILSPISPATLPLSALLPLMSMSGMILMPFLPISSVILSRANSSSPIALTANW